MGRNIGEACFPEAQMILNRTGNSCITDFFKKESSGGFLLMGAAVMAILMANSPLRHYYALLIDTPVAIRIGALEIAKPLLLWVNDGLMAIFFLLVGLELSNRSNIILPALGAIGGMAVPAVIYVLFNSDDPAAMKGWAIPAATDIAFALGVLSLLGTRVSAGLKLFLTSLAIFDDIGAIVIIALFYTSNISLAALGVVAFCIVVLIGFNHYGAGEKSLFLSIGLIMWIAMLKSGVHATLAGVILAMFVPMRSAMSPDESPLRLLEHDLHPTVAFFILPVFAFCNAGVTVAGVGMAQLFHGIPLGIALGLFAGKQVGVFGLCWLGIKLGVAQFPKGVSVASLYGTAALCGIGFTMSLFISSLAFEETGVNLIFDERLGILFGSLASGVLGYAILNASLPVDEKADGAKPDF
jgi:NhaA family Na+:H+ antiporter